MSPPSKAVQIVVGYREAANVFEILDNVSDWLPGKADEEYRRYWKERFGISPEDEQRFASYKQIRKRTYPRPSEGSGDGKPDEPSLFGPRKPIDRFAESFYASASLDEAFTKLASVTTSEETAELRAFYAAYRTPIAELLEESKAFDPIATSLREKLGTRADTYAASVARFYGVADLPPFTALYVWWPPVANVTANQRDHYLLLKYNPTRHASSAASAIDVPIHELTHYVSSHQPEEQKRALTQTFLAGCDPRADVKPVKILEEPMAVAQQKLFASVAAPERFDLGAPWYGGDRWIDPFGKALFPLVAEAYAQGRRIDDALMTRAAKSCAELRAAAHAPVHAP